MYVGKISSLQLKQYRHALTSHTSYTQAAGKVLGVCVVPQTTLEETRANSLAAYRCVICRMV